MKIFKITFALLALAFAAPAAHSIDVTPMVKETNNVTDLDDEIAAQEAIMKDKQDSIAMIKENIKVIEARVDSLNQLVKEAKKEISALEKLKKGHEKDIKYYIKAREMTYERRDQLVFDQNIKDVLLEPYSKDACVEALTHFDKMETKEIIKYKELVEDYGKYTQNLREFLEKKRKEFVKEGWAVQTSDSELVKKFHKDLKGTKYWKIYDKRTNKPYRSIGYLDEVMDNILILERQGFNSQKAYDRVVDLLYGTY
ncbi:MAG: hypothetical protein II592_05550 [Muribaculaceae bacterium]|nr:hypothetical protein [Muribaculaceae bacterium]